MTTPPPPQPITRVDYLRRMPTGGTAYEAGQGTTHNEHRKELEQSIRQALRDSKPASPFQQWHVSETTIHCEMAALVEAIAARLSAENWRRLGSVDADAVEHAAQIIESNTPYFENSLDDCRAAARALVEAGWRKQGAAHPDVIERAARAIAATAPDYAGPSWDEMDTDQREAMRVFARAAAAELLAGQGAADPDLALDRDDVVEIAARVLYGAASYSDLCEWGALGEATRENFRATARELDNAGVLRFAEAGQGAPEDDTTRLRAGEVERSHEDWGVRYRADVGMISVEVYDDREDAERNREFYGPTGEVVHRVVHVGPWAPALTQVSQPQPAPAPSHPTPDADRG